LQIAISVYKEDITSSQFPGRLFQAPVYPLKTDVSRVH